MTSPVRHQLLRDRERWEASLCGLGATPTGGLTLLTVPAPGAKVSTTPPFDAAVSGIALDGCGHVYLAHTGANRLIMQLPACGQTYALPLQGGASPFASPSGLAVAGDTLYLAEAGHGRVLLFNLPTLETQREITAGLQHPTALALDSRRRLVVLDASATPRIRRFHANGSEDQAFDSAMAQAQPTKPVSLAVGQGDVLYVSDAASQQVLAFDGDGRLLGPLSTSSAAQPRALACHGGLVYAADAATGGILVFDAASRKQVGVLPNWRGGVAAMACNTAGDLYVKPDDGEQYVVLQAGKGHVSEGLLEAGPFDAGVDRDWERIALEAEVPPGRTVSVMACTQATATPSPTAWQELHSLDALLDRDPGTAGRAPGTLRYLWLRVKLESPDGMVSPMLHQVHAQTRGISYLEQLPRIYRRDDARTRFLERFLALARSTLQDWDAALDDVARRFDPSTVPAEHLAWLAGCLAFAPPQGWAPDALRKLLARLPDLYARRGTLSGMRSLAEILTGIRIQIFEAYRQRHLWQLGETSALGFDTTLPAGTPDGWVVSGALRTDLAYIGLQGKYYQDMDFSQYVAQRIDAGIDLDLTNVTAIKFDSATLDTSGTFSIRWSGQLQSRHDESYTFHVTRHSGVRLWVAGYPLIDTWQAGQLRTAATLPEPLEAGRWYPVVMEFRNSATAGLLEAVRLEWSSRSQRREAIPSQCLYSLLDEHADLSTPAPSGCVIDIGNTVVGEGSLSPASGYGSALFAEYAHLFTVVAPAGSCCDAGKREALRALIEAEKPAHTDFYLCFTEADMRVGAQSRLGVDSLVAGQPAPMMLGSAVLGADSMLSASQAETESPARVGQSARLGVNTKVS